MAYDPRQDRQPKGLPQHVAGTFKGRSGDDSYDVSPPGSDAVSRRDRAVRFAHDTAVSLMYHTAGIELPGITFPQTRDILMGMAPQGVDEDDVRTIVNIRNAWRRLFEDIDRPVDADLLREYNRELGRYLFFMPGHWRSQPVGIMGSDYRPKDRIDPDMDVEPVLGQVLAEPDPTERALDLFCAVGRGQWFNDGNKRTGLMAANHILVGAGIGTIGLDPRLRHEFGNLLVRYYESDDREPFKEWMREHMLAHVPDGFR